MVNPPISPARSLVRCALALTMSVALLAITQAAPAQASEPGAGLSIPSIEARLAELESAPGLDDAARNAALDLYRSALDSLRRVSAAREQTAEFRRVAAEAPQQLVSIRSELAKPPVEQDLAAPEDASLIQLEQALELASADLQAARQSSTELQAETSRRNERRSALPELLARARQQLADADDPTILTPRENEPQVVTEARRAAQAALRLALQAEIDALEAEAASYDARRELLPAKRDRAQRRVADAETLVAAWQTLVTAQRQVEADLTSREAQRLRRESATQHPVLRGYAEATAELAESRTGASSIADRIDAASREAAQARSDLASMRREFASIQRRLNASGLNKATGLLLRRQYESLPDEASLRRRVADSQKQLESTEYELIEHQEARLGAGDIDRVAQGLLAQIPGDETAGSRAELELVARELATARRDLLDQLLGDSMAYFERLLELNVAQRDTLGQTIEYRGFIEEHILWVRSVSGLRWPSLGDTRDAAGWLIDPDAWTRAGISTQRYLAGRWLVAGVLAALVLLIWLLGVHCRGRIRALGELVSTYKTDSFRYTIYAVLWTFLLAAPLPVAIYALGWLLERAQAQPDVAVAVGSGMRTAALVLFPLLLLRQMLRPCGLCDAHFRWSKSTIKPLRRNLRWFIPTAAPLALLVAALDEGGIESHNASLGRILYTAGLAALAVFLHRIFRSGGPVMRRFMEQDSDNWAHRLRRLWRPMILLAPLALALLSWLGFHYTALQLESRLEQTLGLALLLVIASAVMHRWLLIARRRLAVEEARRRREIAIAEADAKRPAGGSSEESAPAATQALDEDKLDLPALSSQTRQLFRASIAVAVVAGLFLIWAEALPALRILDRMQVWPSVQMVDASRDAGVIPDTLLGAESAESNGSQSNGSGLTPLPVGPGATSAPQATAPGGEPAVSITLADIGFSIVVLIVTWIAFRNVPALAEIIVLQRLPFDAGSRYALSTVLRYCIAILGVIVAFNAIGLSWSKVQWLAAALTFGLAFGLQEIFANFVSGLIILGERPIRLGDTVTVGGVTGTVTRIRMRATTIADWDRKELVIPNKTFITGDVINWTLSDPVLRVIIPVGVSYSSDVEKVNDLLLRAAEENQIALHDPKPQALFRGFGDNTLNFELRVFIGHIENLQIIRDELHHGILKLFRDADIEIAFPQRDLHIRSLGGLESLVQRRQDLPESEIPSK